MFRKNLKSTCKSALKVSLVVGTTLSLINQTHEIFNLSFTLESVVRIILNYLVPFLVASYSRYALLIEQQSTRSFSRKNQVSKNMYNKFGSTHNAPAGIDRAVEREPELATDSYKKYRV